MWQNYSRNRYGRRNLMRPNIRMRNDRRGFNWDFVLGGTSGPVQASFPAMNVWEGDDGVIVSAEIAGVLPEEIEITMKDNKLTVSGDRSSEDLGEDTQYKRRERGNGEFSRTLKLRFQVDADNVQASFKNGILNIELPRLPEEKPKKIEVKSDKFNQHEKEPHLNRSNKND